MKYNNTCIRDKPLKILYRDDKLFLTNQVPLFEDTEIGFLKMLSMKMKPVYFLSKEYVVRKGDIGQEVRIVQVTTK